MEKYPFSFNHHRKNEGKAEAFPSKMFVSCYENGYRVVNFSLGANAPSATLTIGKTFSLISVPR